MSEYDISFSKIYKYHYPIHKGYNRALNKSTDRLLLRAQLLNTLRSIGTRICKKPVKLNHSLVEHLLQNDWTLYKIDHRSMKRAWLSFSLTSLFLQNSPPSAPYHIQHNHFSNPKLFCVSYTLRNVYTLRAGVKHLQLIQMEKSIVRRSPSLSGI